MHDLNFEKGKNTSSHSILLGNITYDVKIRNVTTINGATPKMRSAAHWIWKGISWSSIAYLPNPPLKIGRRF